MAKMLLFSGTANPALAAKVAAAMGTTLSAAIISQFSDSESKVSILEDVLNQNVFIIQPTCNPVNHHIIELCLLAEALSAAGARSIIAIVPYFGYARVPSRAKAISNIFAASGINRVLTLDLHCESISGLCKIPIANLSTVSIFSNYVAANPINNPVIVAPDLGGITRAQAFAAANNTDLAIIEKNRNDDCRTIKIHGCVTNRNCIIIDDIIDTGKTIYRAAQTLKEHGAQTIYAFCAHAVLSSGAMALIEQSACDKIVTTDSIELQLHDKLRMQQKLYQVTIAELLAHMVIEHKYT